MFYTPDRELFLLPASSESFKSLVVMIPIGVFSWSCSQQRVFKYIRISPVSRLFGGLLEDHLMVKFSSP